jgi:hypothetical protein
MPTATASDVVIRLTSEEAGQLLNVLEQTLKETELEVHRTDALQYKEFVQHRENVLRNLVGKLRGGPR